MRHGGSIIWGILLVLLGVLLLLNRLGIVVMNTWGVFWSAALVLWGLSLLIGAFGRREPGPQIEGLALQLKGFEDAAVTLHFAGGRLTLGGGAAPDELLDGEFQGGVAHRLNPDGETARVELRSPNNSRRWRDLEWNIALNGDIPMTLDLHPGAAESVIDLTSTRVKRLVVHAGAGRADIRLPAEAGETDVVTTDMVTDMVTSVVIEGGAGPVIVRVPDGAAARIEGGAAVGVLDVDEERFPQVESGHRSADYETAVNRINIDVRPGVGEVKIV